MDDTIPQNMPHYVYTLAYPDGRVFYVGKGKRSRIHDHERQARNGVKSHKCSIIRKIWASGGQIVKTKLAHFNTHEEAIQYEIALIFFMDDLCNLTYGGDGTVGLTPIVTDETRHKLSEIQKASPYAAEARHKLHQSNIGRKRSEETRQRMRAANKGRRPSPDAIRKASEKNKGRKLAPEHIEKVVAKTRGKKRSEEARRNLRCPHPDMKGHIPWNKGKPMPEAQRVKLLGKKPSEETLRKKSESAKRYHRERRNQHQLEFSEMRETG